MKTTTFGGRPCHSSDVSSRAEGTKHSSVANRRVTAEPANFRLLPGNADERARARDTSEAAPYMTTHHRTGNVTFEDGSDVLTHPISSACLAAQIIAGGAA